LHGCKTDESKSNRNKTEAIKQAGSYFLVYAGGEDNVAQQAYSSLLGAVDKLLNKKRVDIKDIIKKAQNASPTIR
jgi:hypothetical protein